MTLFEFLAGVGTFASILGAVLAWISRDTTRLIRDGDAKTQSLLAAIHTETQRTLDRMDQRAELRTRELKDLLGGDAPSPR
jgi:hypothetical protein